MLLSIYRFLKKGALKVFSIPLINKFLGFFIFQHLSNTIPAIKNVFLVMSIVNIATKLLDNHFLQNMSLFLKQNFLAVIKLAPLFLALYYGLSDMIPLNNMISIFAEHFGFNLFINNNMPVESKLFSTVIFSPLISLVSHKLYPWIDSAIEYQPNLKIAELAHFNNQIELDLNKVHTYFKRTCEANNIDGAKLHIIPSAFSNAYAIGLFNNYSSVCISIGLLNDIILHNQDNPKKAYKQINAVLSHEVGHVLNYHFLKRIVYSMLFGPFITFSSIKIGENKINKHIEDLVDGALFQKQEYEADSHAKKMGHAKELAEALKILNGKLTPAQLNSDAPLTCLYNKFKQVLSEGNQYLRMITEWKATHPTTYNRIAALKAGNNKTNDSKNPLSILVSNTPYQESAFDEDYVPRKRSRS